MKLARWMTCVAIALACLLAPSQVLAEGRDDIDDAADTDRWQVEWTMWLAFPFMDGDASIAGSSVDIDLGPSEILDASDLFIGGQGRLEVWYDNRFGLVVESMGALLEAEQTISRSPVLPSIPVAGAEVDLTWELVFVDIEAGYRIHEGPLGDTGMKVRIDGMAGLRFTHFRQEADLSGLGAFGLSGTAGGTEDWVEPIIGMRIGLLIDERWSIGVRGNVGGFGIEGASDLSWRVAAGVGYRINDSLTLKVGYQAYGLDYNNDEAGRGQIGFDGIMHGPVIGLTWTF